MKSKNSHRSSLTREEISSYIKGGTSKRKHEIEKKSLQSDFDADALEGWSNTKLTPNEGLKRIDRKFISSKKALLFTVITAVLTISTVLILFFGNQNKNQVQQVVQLTVEESDLNLSSSIDTITSASIKQQVKPSVIKEDFVEKKKIDNPPSNPTNHKNNANEVTVNDLPILSLDLPKVTVAVKHSEQAKEIFLADFKLIDYRAYRSKPEIQAKMLVLSGLPANMENENSQAEEMEYKDVNIPYIDYIEKTMRVFGKADYKKTLTRTEIILQTYPDDINALFYSGLCQYNLGQYDAAMDRFYKVLNHNYSNFNEEAEWYLALSYLAKGEKSKAKSIFEMIVKNDSYYSKQAKAYL